jgi:hypothetical protein
VLKVLLPRQRSALLRFAKATTQVLLAHAIFQSRQM